MFDICRVQPAILFETDLIFPAFKETRKILMYVQENLLSRCFFSFDLQWSSLSLQFYQKWGPRQRF